MEKVSAITNKTHASHELFAFINALFIEVGQFDYPPTGPIEPVQRHYWTIHVSGGTKYSLPY
ncbi:hypothetical protein HALO113_50091 [Halomonas sp. 113]|nr:hypothetical protein HALO113_50091 [Halomonas sp. 113]VXC05042.1 hypothetical protein HALO98_40346 [Halomonas titanicae]VXC75544.1 hypothetical protein HALO153_70091 [Halomonas titanicae]